MTVTQGGDATAAQNIDGAVQAIAAPLTVEGPLVMRSIGGDVMDVVVPAGRYDVVCRFFPLDADEESGLRRFRLAVDLLASRTVGPRCWRFEHGKPPESALSRRMSAWPRRAERPGGAPAKGYLCGACAGATRANLAA